MFISHIPKCRNCVPVEIVSISHIPKCRNCKHVEIMVLIFRWRASRAVEIVFHQNCGAFLAGALRARVEIVFTPCSRNVEIVNAWKLGDYEVRLRPSFCKVKKPFIAS